MPQELILVLVGGFIAIVSSLATSVITTFLNYRYERKREIDRLRLELSKAFGQNMKLYGKPMDRERRNAYFKSVQEVYNGVMVDSEKTLEDLALLLGMLELDEDSSKR